MSTERRNRKSALQAAILVAISGGIFCAAPLLASEHGHKNKEQHRHAKSGEWMPGDFHQHSYYTDGSYPFDMVMQKNAEFGLKWWANSEHGGSRNRDGNGNYWDDEGVYPINPILGNYATSGGHQVMWRWQGLRDYVYPDVLRNRSLLPANTLINGFEWNVPGHEHTSTAIHQFDGTATAISEFEYRYDRSDRDTSRNGDMTVVAGYGPLTKTNNNSQDVIAGVAFMQALVDQGIAEAWVVPGHIERANSYTIADFRNWNNAGPDVAFGYEGAPGHQTSSSRGFGTSADGGGTYGGSGWYSATVGGLWDALLGEGRNWWNFASSDFHNHWATGGGDFWPGEYQKTYTFIDTSNPEPIKAIFEGVRSGASWHVEGDLIDKLEFTAHAEKGGKFKAMMGQTLNVKRGTEVTLKIKVRDPAGTNNCPLNMPNPSLAQIGINQPLNMPELDHIDLIAGDVTGYVDPADPDYNKETNESTVVVKTFQRKGGHDKHGYLTYTYKFVADKDRYFRLRGTNLPANVPYETDAAGNPLADSEAETNLYNMSGNDLAMYLFQDISAYVVDSKQGSASTNQLDEVAEAYADLWFYSNPIFINVK